MGSLFHQLAGIWPLYIANDNYATSDKYVILTSSTISRTPLTIQVCVSPQNKQNSWLKVNIWTKKFCFFYSLSLLFLLFLLFILLIFGTFFSYPVERVKEDICFRFPKSDWDYVLKMFMYSARKGNGPPNLKEIKVNEYFHTYHKTGECKQAGRTLWPTETLALPSS